MTTDLNIFQASQNLHQALQALKPLAESNRKVDFFSKFAEMVTAEDGSRFIQAKEPVTAAWIRIPYWTSDDAVDSGEHSIAPMVQQAIAECREALSVLTREAPVGANLATRLNVLDSRLPEARVILAECVTILQQTKLLVQKLGASYQDAGHRSTSFALSRLESSLPILELDNARSEVILAVMVAANQAHGQNWQEAVQSRLEAGMPETEMDEIVDDLIEDSRSEVESLYGIRPS